MNEVLSMSGRPLKIQNEELDFFFFFVCGSTTLYLLTPCVSFSFPLLYEEETQIYTLVIGIVKKMCSFHTLADITRYVNIYI